MNDNYLIIILLYIIIIILNLLNQLWKDNKKKSEIIRLQDNWLKANGIIKLT